MDQTSMSSQALQHIMPLRTRFNSGSVRGNLARRATKVICAIFLSILFTSAVLLFILWLALRPHRPRFHMSSFSDATLSFSLSVRNPNQHIALLYYSMDASVFFSERPVGSVQLLDRPVYQPPKNTTMVYGHVAVEGGGGGGGAGSEQGTGSIGPVRVEVRSRFRFRVATWDTHTQVLHVSCDVDLGPDGEMLPEVRERRCGIYFT